MGGDHNFYPTFSMFYVLLYSITKSIVFFSTHPVNIVFMFPLIYTKSFLVPEISEEDRDSMICIESSPEVSIYEDKTPENLDKKS